MEPSPSSARKSGRKRKITQKVAETDIFKDAEIFGTSPEPKHPAAAETIGSESEESEFDQAAQRVEEEEEEEDNELSVAASIDERDSTSSGQAEDNISDILESDDELQVAATKVVRKPVPNIRKSKAGPAIQPTEEVHQAGAYAASKQTPKDAAYCYTNGNDPDDNVLLLNVKNRWLQEVSLPSRNVDKNGLGGMSFSPYQSRETGNSRVTRARQISSPDESQFRNFWDGQAVDLLGLEELEKYLPTHEESSFVIGGLVQQTVNTIRSGELMNLDDLWPNSGSRTDGASRHGWLLNLGESIKCLEWIPGYKNDRQYLTISVRKEPMLGAKTAPNVSAGMNNSFVPEAPSPSAIQIWEFATRGTGSEVRTIDNNVLPELSITICFDFGPIKAFGWCPIPIDLHLRKATPDLSIGLLATLHDDGFLRIIDVKEETGIRTSARKSIRILQSAFLARPPGTVHTCFAWISSTLLAAGCANGFVAIYDVETHISKAQAKSHAAPMIYEAFHESHILSLSACAPSRPHLLVSTSMDGHWRLTDLRDPTSDHVYTRRERFPPAASTWHEQTQSILSSDELCNIRLAYARTAENVQYLINVDAPIRSIAVSPVHPSTIVGCADGAAYVVNPIRILLKGRVKADEANYRQAWFKHDWRRGRPVPVKDADGAGAGAGVSQEVSEDREHGKDIRDEPGFGNLPGEGEHVDYPHGLARLTTGFRLESLRTGKGKDEHDSKSYYRPKGGKQKAGDPAPVSTSTIYEKEAAIKVVAWNPNLSAGGWAAAGMGDGLLWVEDLSYNQ